MTDTASILSQARDALDRYEPREALDLLEPLKDAEQSADYFTCLIDAHSQAREFARAEAATERACALHPESVDVQQMAGIGAVRARNYPLAEKRFLEVTRIRPGYAPAYNNLGMVYEYLHREAQARDAYAQAIHLDPTLAPAYKNLGRLTETAGQIAEARALYDKARLGTSAAAEFAALLANAGRNYSADEVGPAATGSPTEDYLAQALADAAERHLPPDRKPAVLDLICGAGAVGARLWRKAGVMIGVDPRVHLLAQAQAKNIYFDLQDRYPSAYLRGCKRGETDLIISNSGFVDSGDLLQVFLDIYAVLAPGGLLALTYPTQTDSLGYHIEGGGAFSHDPAYVLKRADFEGLTLLEQREYLPAEHPQLDRAYALMVFAKPA